MIQDSFRCPCKSKKEYRLNLDGGVIGQYSLDLCLSCYFKQNKKFLISEEKVT